MHMGVTVSVISGKGGTGKTTLCAGIAACFAAEGKRVLCIDADIGLRNLDIALGMAEQPAVAFTDVTQGFCKLSDAAEHPALPGLFLLTAPVREQDALVEQQRFGALLREAREAFDWVLIDAAAGIGTSFRLATQFADRCIVAATPDPASLRDAACAADALALEGHELLQLVVNRVQPRLFSRMNLTVDDMMDQTGLPVSLQAFDGSPVYEDLAVLNRWLKTEEASSNPRNATFYNTLPLHDGNHFPGQSKTADYKVRAQKLFDDLDNFFTELEKSGRKVMVVVVPEHGGALKGDKMQVSGLRDIPSPSITNVPTAVKFFGMKAPHEGAPIIIDQPSSYLAVSELVVRALDGKMFSEDSVNWQQYVANLPQSAAVSENANAIVIQYQGKPYVQLNGGSWVPYPQ